MVGNSQITKVLNKYPTLSFNSERGILSGEIFDDYKLDIYLNDFPNRFPKVFEVEKRIRRKADRHINSDNSLCFTTLTKENLYLNTKVKTLLDFIDLILIPYLQNNSYYELNEKYMFDEFSHNINISTYETYVDILKIKNPYIILNLIQDRINFKKKYRPNDTCYCGNDKIKQCSTHYNCYKEFSKLDKNILEFGLISLNKILSK